jgi:hypothetical protein
MAGSIRPDVLFFSSQPSAFPVVRGQLPGITSEIVLLSAAQLPASGPASHDLISRLRTPAVAANPPNPNSIPIPNYNIEPL